MTDQIRDQKPQSLNCRYSFTVFPCEIGLAFHSQYDNILGIILVFTVSGFTQLALNCIKVKANRSNSLSLKGITVNCEAKQGEVSRGFAVLHRLVPFLIHNMLL